MKKKIIKKKKKKLKKMKLFVDFLSLL